MNLAMSSRFIPSPTDGMSNGPTMHFLKDSDSRDKEGISHVRKSLDKAQVNTKEAVNLNFSHIPTHLT